LILSGNEISAAGATRIAEAVENKECLEKLDLDSRPLLLMGLTGIQSYTTVYFSDILRGVTENKAIGTTI